MNLLNFLVYWSQRVYEFFGWLYTLARNTALNAFSWSISAANTMYYRAVDFVSGAVSRALSTAWGWIISHYNDAIGYARFVRSYLLQKINTFYAWVDAKLNQLADWAAGIVRSVQDWAAVRLSELRNWIDAQIVRTRDFAAGLVRNIQDWAASRLNEIETSIEERFGWLIQPNASGEPTLSVFLGNPLGFIMAYIWDVFEDLLCFGLAYGMGTVKYDLPPLPVWSSPGTSGGNIPPSDGVPTPSGLLAPLSTIYVSGHPFSGSHPGIDLGLARGDPVYAMHGGTVLVAGYSNIGFGNQVVVSGAAWWTRYAHLEGLRVSVGQTVNAGQAIGSGNSTGNSTGDHLHLEIKRNGIFIDPLTVL